MSSFDSVPTGFTIYRQYDDAGIRIIRSLDMTVVGIQFAEDTSWEQDKKVMGVLVEDGFWCLDGLWRRDDAKHPQENVEDAKRIVEELVDLGYGGRR